MHFLDRFLVLAGAQLLLVYPVGELFDTFPKAYFRFETQCVFYLAQIGKVMADIS